MKEEIRRRRILRGTSYTLQGEVVLSQNVELEEEESYNSNVVIDWIFIQRSQLEEGLEVDTERKVITYNIIFKNEYASNQTSLKRHSEAYKQQKVLLDNQSICNVIANPKLLKNM